jgi:putative acetyltransferase
MHIRDERPEDATVISAVTTAAFASIAYDAATQARIAEARRAAGITEEAIASAATGLSEAEVIEALRDDGALSLSLVAERGGEIIAHVAFSEVRIGTSAGEWYGLGPVSVLPALQRQGIGSAIIREGLARLRAIGAAGCVLLGYPPYYARFGFELDPALTYAGNPNPALQRLVFGGPKPAGEVTFHPAFDDG